VKLSIMRTQLTIACLVAVAQAVNFMYE
jgi:hypothetical protein